MEKAKAGSDPVESSIEDDFDRAFSEVMADEPVDETTRLAEAEIDRALAADDTATPVEETKPSPVTEEAKPSPVTGELERLLVDFAKQRGSTADASPAALEDPYAGLSEEEKTLLQSYQSEWEDNHKAEAILRRMDIQKAFKEFSDHLAKQIEPLYAAYTELAVEKQRQAIQKAHPDFSDQLADNVEVWIETLPAGLKKAYTEVAASGTAEDVIELISTYKKAKGHVPQASVGTSSSHSSSSKPLPDAARKMSALSPVASTRTVPSASADENDFDAAWADAVKEDERERRRRRR